MSKNIYKIYSNDGKDIIKIINDLGEFIISRNVIFLHSDKGILSVRNKFIKQNIDVLVEKITEEYGSFIPEQVKAWFINDKSEKILSYVSENKEEFENKVLNYFINSLEDLLSEVRDLKNSKGGESEDGTRETTESSWTLETGNG